MQDTIDNRNHPVFLPLFSQGFQRGEPAAPPSSEPETDQQNQDKRCQNEPRDHNDLDSQFAHGGDVLVDIGSRSKNR